LATSSRPLDSNSSNAFEMATLWTSSRPSACLKCLFRQVRQQKAQRRLQHSAPESTSLASTKEPYLFQSRPTRSTLHRRLHKKKQSLSLQLKPDMLISDSSQPAKPTNLSPSTQHHHPSAPRAENPLKHSKRLNSRNSTHPVPAPASSPPQIRKPQK